MREPDRDAVDRLSAVLRSADDLNRRVVESAKATSDWISA
jgi:hypothetical protein